MSRVLLSTVLVATFTATAALHAQSLADVAKKTDEERAKAANAPAKVYTNKDLDTPATAAAHAVGDKPPAPADATALNLKEPKEIANDEKGRTRVLQAPYEKGANARRDIDGALYDSGKDRKLILLDFGANWCVDCVVLDKLMDDPSVQPYLRENFHVVKIDVGNWDRNLDINQQYQNPIMHGIPAVVILDRNRTILASTKSGELITASKAKASDILTLLQSWVKLKR